MLPSSTARLRGVALITLLASGLAVVPSHLPAQAPPSESETPTDEINAKPAYPKPAIDDPIQAESYTKGITHLEEREYLDAKAIFSKLRRSLSGNAKVAAEQCYLEANGGLECEKIVTRIGKGQYRKALKDALKALPKYNDLFVAEDIQALIDECNDKIFHEIETFEEKSNTSAEEEEKEEEEDDGEEPGGRRGNGRDQGGQTGFGQNTSIVNQDPEATTKRALLRAPVREGKKALLWRTGRDLSFISFNDLEEELKTYRYLHLSIRSEDSKNTPALRILFDAEEGPLNAGRGQGGGGRRRAGRTANSVLNRMGFSTVIQPKITWQDLRIDLRKFKPQGGSVKWEDVRALRVIHMQGADGRIYIDNVRLERNE